MEQMAKRALVTGGSRGIGRAVCLALAARGMRVAVNYAGNAAAAEEVVQACLQQGAPDAFAVQADVSDAEQVRALVAAVSERWGGVDVLVNNAGIAPPEQLLTDCTAALWDRVFAVNVRGAFLCCRAALPDMIRKKRGSIVNVSSVWGVVGGSCETPYSASKAALIGLTRALAKEVGPSGVRVNCVAPGYIETEMNAALTDAEREAIRQDTPLQLLGTPEDAAAAIAFLALDEGRFLTGQVLGCDGGWNG